MFSIQVTLVQAARAMPVVNKVTATRKFSAKVASEEEFDRKYVEYFNRPDIDGWEIRKVGDQSHISLGLFLTETAGHG